MAMINELLKEFDIKKVLTYVRNRAPREDYVGPVLFPERTTAEFSFEYFKDVNRLPVQATVQAFGAETPIASREGIEKVMGGIVKIARKINLDERYMIALRREGLGDKALVSNAIFNDLDNLLKSVRDRQEAMRLEAVTTGKIVLNENGLQMTVDYGMPAGHKETLLTTSKWDDFDDSQPITNIQTWVETIIDDTGVKPSRALTSNKVVNNLLRNESIRKMVWGDLGASRPLALPELNNLLAGMGLPVIATYDAKTRTENASTGALTTGRFFPENMFVLLPPDALGETLVGPTAESLMSLDIDVQEFAGVWGNVYQETDPPAIWTKVAMTTIPTFPGVNEVFAAVVQ